MNPIAAFDFCGTQLIADAEGALIWLDQSLLVVADLHLEKGSAYGASGTFLPPYDSRTTLQRLETLLANYSPKTVVCLGDSFHDTCAGARMATTDLKKLSDLTCEREWVWVAGNHDPSLPVGLGGSIEGIFELGPVKFRHEAADGVVYGEVSGHYHPKARIRSRGRTMSCRCFVTDGRRLILPAFGAYAGGLNVLDPALGAILGCNLVVYALRNGFVHKVGRRSLATELEPAQSALV
ncbi:MAG: ligase-associated DNA damage response endonuclease PdeM [Pseudomonadota bacterium]|nr:ligase-associated DNA damage response endonuclease PdeM [Pseudomonadota bacterium]